MISRSMLQYDVFFRAYTEYRLYKKKFGIYPEFIFIGYEAYDYFLAELEAIKKGFSGVSVEWLEKYLEVLIIRDPAEWPFRVHVAATPQKLAEAKRNQMRGNAGCN